MKVIVSMSTIASRNGTLGPTLESLANQTRQPDEIRIFGGGGVDFGDRLWETPGIYDKVAFRLPSIQYKPLAVDRGPISKLSILEERSASDDDLIVTVDDDIIYEPRWLETLVAGAEAHPDCAVGFSGWNADSFLEAWVANNHDGGDYVWAQIPGLCDVLEGWAGIAYRKRFFYIDALLGFASVLHPLPMFEKVDDVWISWHLERRGVKRATISHRMSRERDGALPGLHHLPDFVDLNRKAAIVAFGDASK